MTKVNMNVVICGHLNSGKSTTISHLIKNMIVGTSLADFCVLVVDATDGAFEASFAHDGQTRERAILANALGMKRMICCINMVLLLFV